MSRCWGRGGRSTRCGLEKGHRVGTWAQEALREAGWSPGAAWGMDRSHRPQLRGPEVTALSSGGTGSQDESGSDYLCFRLRAKRGLPESKAFVCLLTNPHAGIRGCTQALAARLLWAQLSLPAPTAPGVFRREKAHEPGGHSPQGQGGHPWLLTGVGWTERCGLRWAAPASNAGERARRPRESGAPHGESVAA